VSEHEQRRSAIPKADDPRVNDPRADEAGVGEPTLDEPSRKEPGLDEPRLDEPRLDEPRLNDPSLDERGVGEAGVAGARDVDEAGGDGVDAIAGSGSGAADAPAVPAEVEADVEPGVDIEAGAGAVEPVLDIEATQLHEVAEEPGGDAVGEDPFEGWPQAQSATVIEDLPDEGVSVEHVSGEIDVPDGYTVFEGTPTGHRRTVAIVVSRFNGGLTNQMLALALETLEETGVAADGVTVMPVPGAFELPLAAMALAKTRRYACVIALGAIVRGETPHFDYIAGEVASGLQLAAIETGIPVSFGVLTVDSIEQGEARVFRAADAVRTALEMADVFAQLRASARPV
jgi:6,7-dimethyl-8-ribityllumazine synthase